MRPNRVLEINTTLANSKTASESVHSPTSPSSQISCTSHSGSSKRRGVAVRYVAAFLDSLSAYPDEHLRDSSQDFHYHSDDSSSLCSPRSLDGIAMQSSFSLDSINSFSTTSSQQARLRMTGRGGSGSRPRTVYTQPPCSPPLPSSPISSVQSNSGFAPLSEPQLDNKRRFVGRGGSGSKQRKVNGKDAGSPSAEGAVEEKAATTMRLPGRGDAGSRPQAVEKGNSGFKLGWPRGKKSRESTSPGHVQHLSTQSSALASPISAVNTRPSSPCPVTTADFDIDIDSPTRSKPIIWKALHPHNISHQHRHHTNLPRVDTDSPMSSSPKASNPPPVSPWYFEPKNDTILVPRYSGPGPDSPSTSPRREATYGRFTDPRGIRDAIYKGGSSSNASLTFPSQPTATVEPLSYSSLHSYRDCVNPIPARPTIVNHFVMSEPESLADVSSSILCSSSSSSPMSSSHGHESISSLSFGRTTRGDSKLEQDGSGEGDAETPSRVISDMSSAATACLSESSPPLSFGPSSAAISSPDDHGDQFKESRPSPSHHHSPSLTSLSSTVSSGTESTTPCAHCGEDIVLPYGDEKEPVAIASPRTGSAGLFNQQGWSGEWNMQLSDVIEALRLL